MNKKTILKIIGIVVLMILLAFLIYYTRNFIIIHKIAQAQENIFSSNNYSYIATLDDVTFTYYYKDGKSLAVWETEEDFMIESWYDEATQEAIYMSPDNLTATITHSADQRTVHIMEPILSWLTNDMMNKIDKSFTFFINTETINDEKCYVLHPLNGITSNTYYFNQKTGVFVRYYLGEQSPVELKSWNINNVTDKDVARPDLTGYEVTDDE